jgi:oligopeptide transport system permease protein
VGRYVIRRLLQMIPVLLGATFLIFAMVFALPGDPLAGKCGDRPCPQAYADAYRAKFHLDDPLPVRYVKYLGNLAHGDLGEDSSGQPISRQIKQAYPVTVKLSALAIVFEIVIGVGAGVLSAVRRRGLFDRGVLIVTLLLISLPVFVTGTVLQYVLGIKLKLVPATAGEATLYELLLPALVLAGLSLAYAARITRTSLAEVLRADYVRTARAKGLKTGRIIGIHALRNALIPVVTFIGADFGGLIGGAVITEGIFNIHGVGNLVFRGIGQKEGNTVASTVTMLVLVFLLMSLLVDLLYAVLDPRIRYE